MPRRAVRPARTLVTVARALTIVSGATKRSACSGYRTRRSSYRRGSQRSRSRTLTRPIRDPTRLSTLAPGSPLADSATPNGSAGRVGGVGGVAVPTPSPYSALIR